MGYEVVFPSERVERTFQKTLTKIPVDYRNAIVTAIRSLAANPRPEGKRTKKLTGQVILSQFTAEYRLRVGPYRILDDIDDQRKKVILLKLAKRDEQTYNWRRKTRCEPGRRHFFARTQEKSPGSLPL